MDPNTIDRVFGAIAQRKRLGRRLPELQDPDFWRRLNPQLTISDAPIAPRTPRVDMPDALREHHTAFLIEEGYLQTPPLLSAEEIAPLRTGVERLVADGLPSGMVWVYDEAYALLWRLSSVLAPMLGESPILLPEDFWVFYIPPGSAGRTGFGAYGPHRDYVVDDAFLAGERPRVLTAWIPLTDVTTLDSCMYVVHPSGDPDYLSPRPEVRRDQITLTDIRALPTPAGALIAFSSRVAHWGSRSSRFATGPRIAMACILQRRDVPPFLERTIDLEQPLTWERRWALVMDSVGHTGLEGDRVPISDR